jgi:hypothetical protein
MTREYILHSRRTYQCVIDQLRISQSDTLPKAALSTLAINIPAAELPVRDSTAGTAGRRRWRGRLPPGSAVQPPGFARLKAVKVVQDTAVLRRGYTV